MKKQMLKRVLALACMTVVGLSACSGSSSTASTTAAPVENSSAAESTSAAGSTEAATDTESSKVVTMAVNSAWDTMMPMAPSGNYGDIIFDQIYDRLVYTCADGTHEPRLAKTWEISEDHLTLTFVLQDNAVWHDGTPLTAKDVEFTAKLYTNPDVNNTRRANFKYIDGTDDNGAELSTGSVGVTAIDDTTVEFKLKNPIDPETILTLFNRYFYILPQHILDGKTADELNGPDIWANPVGSGPFVYENEISGERMELTANESYFLGEPDIDRLVIRVVSDTNLLAGLMTGEIDISAGAGLSGIPLQDWEMAKAQENLVTESVENYSYQYMIMNNQTIPQTIRQAISMAINRDQLVNALLQGEGVAITSPLVPSHPYFNEDLLPISYDVETAKAMVEEEGWDRELVFLVPTGNQVREQSAILIQQDLEKIGIKTQIQSVDFATMTSTIKTDKADLALIGSAGSPEPGESINLVTPGAGSCFGSITDTTLSEIMQRGAAGLSFEERKPIYDEYQEELMVEMPYAWLYSPNRLSAYNQRLSNIVMEDADNLNWGIANWIVSE